MYGDGARRKRLLTCAQQIVSSLARHERGLVMAHQAMETVYSEFATNMAKRIVAVEESSVKGAEKNEDRFAVLEKRSEGLFKVRASCRGSRVTRGPGV